MHIKNPRTQFAERLCSFDTLGYLGEVELSQTFTKIFHLNLITKKKGKYVKKKRIRKMMLWICLHSDSSVCELQHFSIIYLWRFRQIKKMEVNAQKSLRENNQQHSYQIKVHLFLIWYIRSNFSNPLHRLLALEPRRDFQLIFLQLFHCSCLSFFLMLIPYNDVHSMRFFLLRSLAIIIACNNLRAGAFDLLRYCITVKLHKTV